MGIRKSSGGNPYHDENGRFTHGPDGGTHWKKTHEKMSSEEQSETLTRKYIKSKLSKEEYEERQNYNARESKDLKAMGRRFFNGSAQHNIGGNWEIGRGGYDLEYEVYHKGTPAFGCVDGEIEVYREEYRAYARDFSKISGDSIKESNTDYQISHRPPTLEAVEDGEADTAVDISIISMPGYYEHPERYPSGLNECDKESYEVLKRIRNNPEAEVTVYRGTPKNELNDGDWVTLSKSYAEIYANDGAYAGEDSKVYAFTVKAKELTFAGDSINEFGYRGEKVNG